MKKQTKYDSTHLTLKERKIIQAGIENGATKAAIGRTIGKDETTVAKEIRKHRQFKPRNTFNCPVLCTKLKTCQKACVRKCDQYEEPTCTRRDRSPGACNKCPKNTCRMDKYYYDAVAADKAYRKELAECREGINLEPDERERIGGLIAPLLAHGQSVHQILSNHSEIGLCERTLYEYIESGVFKEFGVDNFSLKEQVNRKQFKQKYKKRKEPANYDGRRYTDFIRFRDEHPQIPVTEMDTVYNSPSGPYLQTFIFANTGFMIGFLHGERTSESMADRINQLQQALDPILFSRLFSLVLTDRGSEFEKFRLFEQDAMGQSRLRIFYCDPMQSSQKPHVENNHNYVRDILPNGYPMDVLSQADIDCKTRRNMSPGRKR